MNRSENPYRPGAGLPPPELAGRDSEIEDFQALLDKGMGDNPDRSMLMHGLRGVGKTVLLNEFDKMALGAGWFSQFREVRPDEKAFRATMAEMCRKMLLEMSRRAQLKALLGDAIGVLKSFIVHAKVKDPATGMEWSVGIERVAGKADSGDLAEDLTDLFLEIGQSARRAGIGVIFFLDEAQRLGPEDLSALLMALHRVNQKSLPVLVVPAGLPQLPLLAQKAQSYTERLFDLRGIGQLDEAPLFTALEAPAAKLGAHFEREAVRLIYQESSGYPFFIQEWGRQVWDLSLGPAITVADVETARPEVLSALDDGFFAVRDEQATKSERLLLRAMAELGSGPYQFRDIGKGMGSSSQEITPLRDRLIKKGLIYSPRWGQLEFTVPQYDAFIRRAYPRAE